MDGKHFLTLLQLRLRLYSAVDCGVTLGKVGWGGGLHRNGGDFGVEKHLTELAFLHGQGWKVRTAPPTSHLKGCSIQA